MFDFFVDFLQKFFHREETRPIARERLRLVLVQDRAAISPALLEDLRVDLLRVIQRYMEIDEAGMELMLERKDGSVGLAASIPIVSIRRVPLPDEGREGRARLAAPAPASTPAPATLPAEAAAPSAQSAAPRVSRPRRRAARGRKKRAVAIPAPRK